MNYKLSLSQTEFFFWINGFIKTMHENSVASGITIERHCTWLGVTRGVSIHKWQFPFKIILKNNTTLNPDCKIFIELQKFVQYYVIYWLHPEVAMIQIT